ncbi:MAG: HEAT repeat domain-containing protein [Gemmatimonadota bacterium]|nr:HEAT repeat domain-containing protein [Gemmatimonadota bacterium]
MTLTNAQADATSEDGGAPFSPVIVETLLQVFGKAARAHQLYLPNNPVYHRALVQLRAAFVPLWAETDQLVLAVSETELRWEGRAVMHESSKAESLPWLFYKDGVRELTLLPGVEEEELIRLLDLLQRVRRSGPEDDDLLTLMWEQDFLFLRYRAVQLATDEDVPAASETPGLEPGAPGQVTVSDDSSGAAESNVVEMKDFDSAVYFLDDKDIEYLRDAMKVEYEQDLRRNIICMLYDLFQTEPAPSARDEVAEVLDQLILHLLAAGDFPAVALALREAPIAIEGARDLQDAQRDRLRSVADRLGGAETLGQLLQSLDDAPDPPPQADLDELFAALQPGTLSVVLSWLGKLRSGALRASLERAATRLAASNTTELVRLIDSANREVVLEAIKRAGDLKTASAVPTLGKQLGAADAAVRIAAALALSDIGSAGAMQQLERGVEDEDREVRIAAVRALGSRGHRAALPRVNAAIKSRGFRDADLTEKMVYFETYGLLAGAGGVEQLEAVLNARTMFGGKREDAETRACAALALGKIGTPAAFDALRPAAADKEIMVRNAVAKAMRGSAA